MLEQMPRSGSQPEGRLPMFKSPIKLLVLIYRLIANGSSHLAALSEYHHLKDLRKSPISRIGLRIMLIKFELTEYLGVLPGRRKKPIGIESVEEVATDAVERASSSIYSLASSRSVSGELEMFTRIL
ncbi:hypothetical protein TNCV_538411 [Trichonephila clavipes]|nr:hypothetical protein TNCV_538411 [Trichonephila clavipes]